eukprot:6212816-Pleurochrysis_carterae.AAC.3
MSSRPYKHTLSHMLLTNSRTHRRRRDLRCRVALFEPAAQRLQRAHPRPGAGGWQHTHKRCRAAHTRERELGEGRGSSGATARGGESATGTFGCG